jgi:hypothetical protein
MSQSRRRTIARQRLAIAASLVVHAAGLTGFLLSQPTRAPPGEDAPMTVVLVAPDVGPRLAPHPAPPRKDAQPLAESAGPSPAQALARPAPSPAPGDTPADAAPGDAAALAAAVAPPRNGPSPPSGLAPTLRTWVGCGHTKLLDLTKAEQAACDEAMGKGSKTAPLYAVISPKDKAIFDGTYCAPTDEWCLYRMGRAPYPGLAALMRKARE